MGQAIICAYNIDTGAFINGTGMHPNMIMSHGYANPGHRRGSWVCAEATIGYGPNKYSINGLEKVRDRKKRGEVKKQIEDFFEKHTANPNAVLDYAEEFGFAWDMIDMLSHQMRGRVNDMTHQSNTQAQTDWLPYTTAPRKKVLAIARSIKSDILELIKVTNLKIKCDADKIPVTLDKSKIVEAVYKAAVNKHFSMAAAKRFETSYDAIVTIHNSKIAQLYELLEEDRKAFFAKRHQQTVAIIRAMCTAPGALSARWRTNASDKPFDKLRDARTFLHINGNAFPLEEVRWAISDEKGNLIMSCEGSKLSIKTDENVYSLFDDDELNRLVVHVKPNN